MQLDSSDIALVVYVEYAEENGNNTKRIDGYMLMNSNTNLLIYIKPSVILLPVYCSERLSLLINLLIFN